MTHTAAVRWAGRMTFVGRAGTNHLVPMDTTPDFDGDSSATKPIELLLIGLGGCTGMDVVSLLRKMRVNFDSLEMNITAEKSDGHPSVYTSIDLEYVITGTNIDPDKAQRAIDLSQGKYCSVSAMLGKACPISYRYRIIGPVA
jgi:putative redox protein